MTKNKRKLKFCPRCGYCDALIIEDGELAMKIREDYLKNIQKNED